MSAENGHEVIDDVQELPGIDEKKVEELVENWITGYHRKITKNVRIDVKVVTEIEN